MKLFDYKEHTFRTSNMARSKITDIQRERAKDIDLVEYANLQAESLSLESELKKVNALKPSASKTKKEEALIKRIESMTDKIIPYTIKMQEAELSAAEVLEICFFYSKEYKGKEDHDLFLDILFDMEEDMGSSEFIETLEEAKDKVFTEIETEHEIQQAITKKKDEKKEEQLKS